MKRIGFIIVMIVTALVTINSKTTYIPTYLSYMHIVSGGDTIAVSNNLDTLELVDPEGMFKLRIDQEDVTSEKVKAIKRMKAAAGWMTFLAVTGGVSTAFSNNSLQYMVRSSYTSCAARLASIYKGEEKSEKSLDIIAWIDNLTDKELMVCDMERGLTWWILPHQSMELKLNNPEASQLRISDSKSNFIRYATILAGNKVTKYEIEIENDEYWYSPVWREINSPHDDNNLMHYLRISKLNYEEVKIDKQDFKKIKKELKK